jgi:hypothetical protein
MKSSFSCEQLRATMSTHGFSVGECREQPFAWCITFRSTRKEPKWTHVCTATHADCTTLRAKLIVPGMRVDSVSKCVSWR